MARLGSKSPYCHGYSSVRRPSNGLSASSNLTKGTRSATESISWSVCDLTGSWRQPNMSVLVVDLEFCFILLTLQPSPDTTGGANGAFVVLILKCKCMRVVKFLDDWIFISTLPVLIKGFWTSEILCVDYSIDQSEKKNTNVTSVILVNQVEFRFVFVFLNDLKSEAPPRKNSCGKIVSQNHVKVTSLISIIFFVYQLYEKVKQIIYQIHMRILAMTITERILIRGFVTEGILPRIPTNWSLQLRILANRSLRGSSVMDPCEDPHWMIVARILTEWSLRGSLLIDSCEDPHYLIYAWILTNSFSLAW